MLQVVWPRCLAQNLLVLPCFPKKRRRKSIGNFVPAGGRGESHKFSDLFHQLNKKSRTTKCGTCRLPFFIMHCPFFWNLCFFESRKTACTLRESRAFTQHLGTRILCSASDPKCKKAAWTSLGFIKNEKQNMWKPQTLQRNACRQTTTNKGLQRDPFSPQVSSFFPLESREYLLLLPHLAVFAVFGPREACFCPSVFSQKVPTSYLVIFRADQSDSTMSSYYLL